MSQISKSKKINYRVLIIVTVALIVVSVILVKFVAEPFIEKKIEHALAKNSISIDHIDLTWITPGLSLQGIAFADSGNSEDFVLDGELQHVEFIKVHVLKLLSGKIHIKSLTVNQGTISLVNKKTNKTPEPMVFGRNILIDEVVIDRINFSYADSSSSQLIRSTDIHARIDNLHLGVSDTFEISEIPLQAFSAEKTTWYKSDSLNTLNVFGLEYSGNNNLLVDSIILMPAYEGYEYTNKFEYQTDRIEAMFKKIEVRNIPAGSLMKGDFIASQINIDSFAISSFRDKRKDFRHVHKKMLQEVIYNFPGSLKIDTLKLSNGYVFYSEHAEKADEAGFLIFDRINAFAQGINNDTLLMDQQEYLRIKAEGRLLNKGIIDLEYLAKLYDEDHSFSLKGKLGPMDLEILNVLFEKNESASLAGNLHSLSFEFQADSLQAKGELRFIYDSLDMVISGRKGPVRDKFATWFINYKLINSNPLPGKEVRTATIEYKRDPERFFFNYSIKSLMTGIKSTVMDE